MQIVPLDEMPTPIFCINEKIFKVSSAEFLPSVLSVLILFLTEGPGLPSNFHVADSDSETITIYYEPPEAPPTLPEDYFLQFRKAGETDWSEVYNKHSKSFLSKIAR